MASSFNFSVVIATYTGIETIEDTFRSLLNQEQQKTNHEVVIVIDGPNEPLRDKVEEAKKEFEKNGINFTIKQFDKNRGRFEARLEGARLAKSEYILIIDDRVEVPPNYLVFMSALGEEAAMPDVAEKKPDNIVSLAMSRIRRKAYGKQCNPKPFYITSSNFDNSTKGTTSLWINKRLFIDSSNQLATSTGRTKNANEDTGILRNVVDSGTKIYKTSEIKIRYNSRSSARSEFIHIFHRGPRFIDYYLSPGRRFYIPLIMFYVLLIPAVIALSLFPLTIIILLLASLAISVWIAGKTADILTVWVGLSLISLAFGAGLVWGLIQKILSTRLIARS